MKIERDMKLSFDLTIEKILELIKTDILKVKEVRRFKTDRVYIKTQIFA